LENPNPAAIEVTSLTVAVAAEPSCPAESFALTPAGVSGEAPLRVPAGDSVRLPTEAIAAPTIAMRDLSVSQDGCQGIEVSLVFDGEAHG
jgi:hypothetical protein